MKSLKKTFASAALGLSLLVGGSALANENQTPSFDSTSFQNVETTTMQLAQADPQGAMIFVDPQSMQLGRYLFQLGGTVYNGAYQERTIGEVIQGMLDAIPDSAFANGKVNKDFVPADPDQFVQYMTLLVAAQPRDERVKLVTDIASAYLSSLDAHSSFIPIAEAQAFANNSNGGFAGLGIAIEKHENGNIIVKGHIGEDGPAAKAGMLEGDQITHVGGQSIKDMPLEDAIKLMKGEIGTEVDVVVEREGSPDPISVTVTRGFVEQSDVRATRIGDNDNIGYVALRSFSANAGRDIKRQIEEMEASGNAPSSYILDLRFNSGGLIDQAQEISDHFLDDGKVVSARARGREGGVYNAVEGDLIDGKPLVVLVNGGSASASEIVSGVLQYYDRATVIGTDTFGKGSVQTIMPTPLGLIRLTTQLYYVAGERPVQGYGVKPDIKVEFGMAAGLDFGRSENSLDGTITNPDGKALERVAERNQCVPANDNQTYPEFFLRADTNDSDSVDATLLCAVEYLQGESKFTKVEPAPTPAPATPAAPK